MEKNKKAENTTNEKTWSPILTVFFKIGDQFSHFSSNSFFISLASASTSFFI